MNRAGYLKEIQQSVLERCAWGEGYDDVFAAVTGHYVELAGKAGLTRGDYNKDVLTQALEAVRIGGSTFDTRLTSARFAESLVAHRLPGILKAALASIPR